MPDPASGPAPRGSSLLIHFLSLETWHAYSRETTLIVPIEHIKSEAQAYCPHVTEIDTWVTPSPVLSNLIADIFDDLQCVTFAYEQFSADIVTALLFHKETLVNIAVKVDGKACGIERDEPPPEETRLKASDRLALHPHTMDMDFVEQSHWVCKNLRVLKVLIRGLDTKEKIDRALALWKEGSNRDGTNDVSSERNQGRKRNADGEEMPEQSKIAFHGGGTNPLIDVRVARHLLKFDKLNTVWLGTSTHHV
ncbi:hypothetical protein BGX28_001047 [Mortierella sp. GBA30]|nr:hypothetical protein BGX28_001047 [Mortierella sp. GBA30]